MATDKQVITEELINDIAQDLDIGLSVFVHRKTLETISYPNPDQYSEDEMEVWQEDIDKVENNAGDYFEVERWHGSDMHDIMSDFVEEIVTQPVLKARLTEALQGRKPFQNFKFLIDNSGDNRESWFSYKLQREKDWVRRALQRSFDL